MQRKWTLFPALMAVIITVIAVWYTQHPTPPRQTTWSEVLAEARTGGYRLITTEELAERYHNISSNLLLVDTRQEWEYRTGHIGGALNFSMGPTWWEGWRKAGDLKTLLGTDKQRDIVFY